MKIAVLMAGHLRAWDYCKNNFMSCVYDTEHQIDVFVHTYREKFRSDYRLHKENEMRIILTDKEIIDFFQGINVPRLAIEDEWGTGLPSQIPHKRKTLLNYQMCLDYEKEHGKYDLIFSYRPDILLDNKVDYNLEYEKLQKNPKLVLMANGALNMPEENPFCGMGLNETMAIYFNRLNEIPEHDPMLFHTSFTHIKHKYGIQYEQSLHMSVVRLDGNRNYRVEK